MLYQVMLNLFSIQHRTYLIQQQIIFFVEGIQLKPVLNEKYLKAL